MKRIVWHLFLIVALCFYKNAKSQIVINELCTINVDVIEDAEGDKSDWIELYNKSNSPENLSNYSLYSKNNNISFELPTIELAPEAFIVIFISGKSKISPQIHTNFKMEINDTILLFQNQTIVSEIVAKDLFVDHSYGAVDDGIGNYEIFTSPTPGASNEFEVHYAAYTAQTQFNLQSGFYQTPITLELSNPTPNATIYYTTDGSIPYFNSPIYTSPIQVNKNMIIKSYCTAPGILDSKIITKSYFINETISLPVVSISTDSLLLFDATSGLLQPGPNAESYPPFLGANFWSDNQIKVHVQIFDKNKNEQINQFCELQIHGGSVNRSQAMKSFRLLSKKKFEKDRFYAKLIEDKPAITAYRKFVLRNGSSDFLKSQLREGFIHKNIIKYTNVDANGYEPCLVFINGNFYGMMEIREKIDEYYVEQNHNIDKDNVDVLADTNLVDIGDWTDFDSVYRYVLHHDMKQNEHFNFVDQRIDLKNMADYFFVETYFDNNDWPSGNLRLWSQRNPRGKYRYIAFDLDASLGTFTWSPSSLNMLHESLNYFTTVVPIKHCIIFKKMLENTSFKHYFINRYADLSNTSFSSENLLTMLDTVKLKIQTEVNRHYTAWEKEPSYWEFEINNLIIPYIKNRHTLSREDVLNEFALPAYHQIKINTEPEDAFQQLNINTIVVHENNFDGYYYETIPISFKVNPKKGFVFSHWLQNNGNRYYSDSISVNLTENSEFTAVYYTDAEKNDIVVYPNPNDKNYLYVRMINDLSSLKNIAIYNTLGQKVFISSHPKIKNEIIVEIETQQLKQGIYFLNIELNNSTRVVKFSVL